MKSRGFTLIELVMVIVILGALAAVALPKFVDLKSDAERAVVESSVGAIATARILFVTKAAACGSSYASAPVGVFTFLHFDNNNSRAPTCDDFNSGFGSVTPGPVGTMDLKGMKSGIQANPDDSLTITNTAGADTMSFTSKSGRTVSITVNQTTGAVSWSATPAY